MERAGFLTKCINFFLTDEYTLRWDDSFYAGGVCIALAGVLAWVTGHLQDLDENKESSRANNDSCSIQTNRKH